MTSIAMLFVFPVQNSTEIGQSAAELCMAKNAYFKMAAVRHLEF